MLYFGLPVHVDAPRARGLWPLKNTAKLCVTATAIVFLSAVLTHHNAHAATTTTPVKTSKPTLVMTQKVNTTSTHTSNNSILAIVNQEPVTLYEVKNRMLRLEAKLNGKNALIPNRADLFKEVLEDVIEEKIQLQRAHELDIHADEKQIDAALKQLLQNTKNTDSGVALHGLTTAQLRTEIANQQTIERLRERETTRKIRITEGDVSDFLKEQLKDAPAAPPRVELAQILIAIPEGSDEATVQQLKQKTDALFAQATQKITSKNTNTSNSEFLTMVKTHSQAKDAKTNPSMGMRTLEALPDIFAKAAEGQSTGTVLPPVRSDAGFHIIKVLYAEKGLQALNIIQTNVHHILLSSNNQNETNTNADADAIRGQAMKIQAELQSGSIGFDEAAAKYSQDAGTAKNGGNLGWVSSGQLVPEFEKAMNALDSGKLSNPVVTRFGVHLIWVQERRQYGLNAEEQREWARQGLRAQLLDQAYTTWRTDLRSQAYVEYRNNDENNA